MAFQAVDRTGTFDAGSRATSWRATVEPTAPASPSARLHGPQHSLARFLAEHLGRVESDDVGPIIGQAASMSEFGHSAALQLSDRACINAALSGGVSAASL